MSYSEYQKNIAAIRILVARLFTLSIADQGGREKFIRDRGWVKMPPIVPSMWSTQVGDVARAASRYLDDGNEAVLLPVLMKKDDHLYITVICRSRTAADEFWTLPSDSVHDEATMGQLVDALDPNKTWSVEDLGDDIAARVKTVVEA